MQSAVVRDFRGIVFKSLEDEHAGVPVYVSVCVYVRVYVRVCVCVCVRVFVSPGSDLHHVAGLDKANERVEKRTHVLTPHVVVVERLHDV